MQQYNKNKKQQKLAPHPLPLRATPPRVNRSEYRSADAEVAGLLEGARPAAASVLEHAGRGHRDPHDDRGLAGARRSQDDVQAVRHHLDDVPQRQRRHQSPRVRDSLHRGDGAQLAQHNQSGNSRIC